MLKCFPVLFRHPLYHWYSQFQGSLYLFSFIVLSIWWPFQFRVAYPLVQETFFILFLWYFLPFHLSLVYCSGTPIRWVLDLCTLPLNLPSFWFSTVYLVLPEISLALLRLYLLEFKFQLNNLVIILQLFFPPPTFLFYVLVAVLFYFSKNINYGAIFEVLFPIFFISMSLSFLFWAFSFNCRDFPKMFTIFQSLVSIHIKEQGTKIVIRSSVCIKGLDDLRASL